MRIEHSEDVQLGYRALGFGVLGFRALGFGVLGFRALGFGV